MSTEFSTFSSYVPLMGTGRGREGDPLPPIQRSTMPSTVVDTMIDFDANLFHKDMNFESATKRAREKGVEGFVVPGSTLTDSAQAIAAAQQFDFVVAATAGVHPYNTESIPLNEENIMTLKSLLASPQCLAVGECGLDFTDGFPSSSFQVDWFRFHIALAIQYQKPLYLHLRNSHQCFTKMLEEETISSVTSAYGISPLSSQDNNLSPTLTLREHLRGGSIRSVVHCFTGTVSELKYLVELDCYIGFTGHIFSLSDEAAKEMLQIVPLTRLVIETDAPYMGFKGCREDEDKAKSRKYPNVPASLPKIASRIAELLGVSYSSLCSQTTANTIAFFKTM